MTRKQIEALENLRAVIEECLISAELLDSGFYLMSGRALRQKMNEAKEYLDELRLFVVES